VKKKLALFDFDGTITGKDSLPDFIQHAVGRAAYWSGLLRLSPILAAYTLKIIPNNIAKERLLAHFFAGWDAEHFQKIADQYALSRIDSIVRPEAVERMRRHQAQGDTVVVVSASMESWLQKWCELRQADLIATQLEIRAGKLTGRFATKNCYGIEKVNRIRERYNLAAYSSIHAYGDSRGDKEMLKIATVRHYREFK
jgi:phosphatidylglycerophosphatase C